ncbi:ABC transporter substrate-binding protein [Agarivorans albus]|uniref:ABC-type sugar transport system n=1 Tax=Agarivorans albus MKT 106 TaxID=1331007 RepID=R9PQQ8_AGAAL|nr:ABC-type sugar transport system [Agarivorans albus]GAD00431.1 ABC-type sugar transport system [Agarivorans albus MKT 106]
MRQLVSILGRFFCVFLLLLAPAGALAKQKILVIESYHQEYAWDKSYIEGLESVLGEHYQLTYFQMDTKRLPVTRHRSRGELAWQRYLDVKPDLVILGDDNALKYLGSRFAKTLVPVVYLGINNNPRRYHVHQRHNITGVLERPLIKRSISSIKPLFPNGLNRMLILFDDGTTAKTVLQEMFGGDTQLRVSGVDVELRLISRWDTWQQAVITAKDEGFDAIAFGLYHTLRDERNKYVDANEVLKWSSQHTPLPPFGFWDFAVGKDKTIGGLVLFGYEQGRIAGELAHTILTTDVEPHTLGPKTAEKGRYLFSRSELERHQMSLPRKMANKANFVE